MLGKLPKHTAHHGEPPGEVPARRFSHQTQLPGPDEALRAVSLLRGSSRAPQDPLYKVWFPTNRSLSGRLDSMASRLPLLLKYILVLYSKRKEAH